MALPSSGAMTIAMIASEFGVAAANRTVKACAAAASISASNVGLKNFYGLVNAINPAYVQDIPPTTTGWSTNYGISIYSDLVRGFGETKDTTKFAASSWGELTRTVTVTPNVVYRWQCVAYFNASHGGSGTVFIRDVGGTVLASAAIGKSTAAWRQCQVNVGNRSQVIVGANGGSDIVNAASVYGNVNVRQGSLWVP